MDELNELLKKTDDPQIRDALNRAFRMGVETGWMITQYGISDGAMIAKHGAFTGSALTQSGATKNAN